MKPSLLIILICTVAQVAAQDFKQHIQFLASDSLHGRAPATQDERKAATYVAEQLAQSGATITWQKVPFEKDSALNVLAFLDSKKDSTIVISAHYDHMGYGGNKSNEILKKGIHPGADD